MRNTREPTTLKQETVEKECVHYWIIDFPDGPVSTGKCKRCGMVREFFNCLDSIELQNDERYKINRNN
jgi:hypothetical protein